MPFNNTTIDQTLNKNFIHTNAKLKLQRIAKYKSIIE